MRPPRRAGLAFAVERFARTGAAVFVRELRAGAVFRELRLGFAAFMPELRRDAVAFVVVFADPRDARF